MTASPSNISRAFELLELGNPKAALEYLESDAAHPVEHVARQIGIALCGRALELQPLRVEATRRLLELEAGNLWGNLLQGELHAEARDNIAALRYYMHALQIAEQHSSLPAQLIRELSRARSFCAEFTKLLDNHVRQGIADQVSDATPGGLDLFNQSLDILFGKKQIYLQSPRYYYYPGLPQRQFFPAASFDWIPELESRTANIRSEALNLLASPNSFQPYLKSDPTRPRKSQDGMTDNPDWSACYLIHNGQVVDEVAERCPETMAAIQRLPLCTLPKRSPSVLFSLLKPGAHIPPHCGLVNTRLICHLPIECPPNCHLRVGNEVKEWKEGKVWVFDDSIEHEAWNRSDKTRIILLFEIWRPELSSAERQAISELFKALDGSNGRSPSWEI